MITLKNFEMRSTFALFFLSRKSKWATRTIVIQVTAFYDFPIMARLDRFFGSQRRRHIEKTARHANLFVTLFVLEQ